MNMLSLSKLENGKLELKKEPVDLMDLVKQIVLQLEHSVKENGVKLRVVSSKEKISTELDRLRMLEVLYHLAGNAVKFTKNGTVEIAVRDTGDSVRCTITDTGVGIGKEHLPKVFEKFQQFGWAPGGGEKGMGLGLAIAKGLVELHGGKIQLESTLSKGTRVTFTLPKAFRAQKDGKSQRS